MCGGASRRAYEKGGCNDGRSEEWGVLWIVSIKCTRGTSISRITPRY